MKISRIYTILLALVLAFTIGCVSVSGPNEYTISGTLLDGNGGPINGAVINITGKTNLVISEFGENGAWTAAVKGNVTITPEHADYSFIPVNIKTSKAKDDINFTGTLEGMYSVSGTVVDTDGDPIEGVKINITGDTILIITEFDENGGWRAAVQGDVNITPRHKDYSFTPPYIKVEESNENINFVGTNIGTYKISGKILDSEGQPIEGAIIYISGATTLVVQDFDEGGYWEAEVRGTVTVRPEHENYKFDEYGVKIKNPSDEVDFIGKQRHPDLPITWQHLLLVYPETHVTIKHDNGEEKEYHAVLSESLQEVVIGAFENLPNLISYATQGDVLAETTVVLVNKPITSVSKLYWEEPDQEWSYWVSPWDILEDLAEYAPAGEYDSVHVIWQNEGIRTYFGLGGIMYDNRAYTFDSLMAGEANWWLNLPGSYGEPILHEWLHGVTTFLDNQGYGQKYLPDGDVHGAENYGYTPSPIDGWMDYYCDYMQCKVWDEGKQKYLGISEEAWAIGVPSDSVK